MGGVINGGEIRKRKWGGVEKKKQRKNNENLIWGFNNWDVWGEKQKFFQN